MDQHPPTSVASPCLGIPRQGTFNAAAFEQAITALLAACGIAGDTVHTGKTAQRVRELWQKRLLGGYDIDPAAFRCEFHRFAFGDLRRRLAARRSAA